MATSKKIGTVHVDKPVDEMNPTEIIDAVNKEAEDAGNGVIGEDGGFDFARFLDTVSATVENMPVDENDEPQGPPPIATEVLVDQLQAAVKIMEFHLVGGDKARPKRMTGSQRAEHAQMAQAAFSFAALALHYALYEAEVILSRRPQSDPHRFVVRQLNERVMPGFYNDMVLVFAQLDALVKHLKTEVLAADRKAQLSELGKERTKLQKALDEALEKIPSEDTEDEVEKAEDKPKTATRTRATRNTATAKGKDDAKTETPVEAPKAPARRTASTAKPAAEANGNITVSVGDSRTGLKQVTGKAQTAEPAAQAAPKRTRRSLRSK